MARLGKALQNELSTEIYAAIENGLTPLERNGMRDIAVIVADKLEKYIDHFNRIEFLDSLGLNQYGNLTNEEYDKWLSRPNR